MIERVLVPLDGSDLAAQALPHAVVQATEFGARILLLRVQEPETGPISRRSGLLEIEEDAESYLASVAEELAVDGLEIDWYTRSGRPAETIIAFAAEHDVGFIVMSTHGRGGMGRWVYGSVADKVLRAAGVPVFLTRASTCERPMQIEGYGRLLVPLDGSRLAELALPYAEAWAHAFEADVILIRVPTLPSYVSLGPEASTLVPSLLSEAYSEADTYLANVTRRLKAKGLRVHKAAVDPGAVADTIIDYAEEAGVDCIVMSTHGRSGLKRWVYGSVADRVLRGASAPVLLVRTLGAEPS